MTTRQDRIQHTLTAIFKPQSLEIIDESGRHANHAGRQGLRGDLGGFLRHVGPEIDQGGIAVPSHKSRSDAERREWLYREKVEGVMTTEDYYLVELCIIDELSRENGNAIGA